MNTEVVIAIASVVIGLICTSMVPWAFVIERRLARIESKIDMHAQLLERIDHLSERVRALELEK